MQRTLTTALALTLVLAGPITASEWGGHHGTIHLSFSAAPEITPVAVVEPMGEMGVMVDVHAVLAGLDPILYEGARILDCGGFEMKLVVEGAEDYEILKQTVPVKHLNASQDPAQCMVGLFDSISLKDGPATLVSWQVLIRGEAANVSFHVDPDGLHSAGTLEGCVESGTYILWSGAYAANQHGLLFSAGYVPAFLNWEGETDLTPRIGTVSWQETGLFTLSE